MPLAPIGQLLEPCSLHLTSNQRSSTQRRTSSLDFATHQEMTMRKAFRIALLAALVLTGVGSLGPTSVQAAPAKMRIFVGLGAGTQPEDKAKQDAVAKLWNDANADLQISFDVVTTDAQAQLKKQLLSIDPPDLVGPLGIGDIYAAPQLWADLTPYLRKDKVELNMQDYDDATLQLFQLAGGN